MNRYHKHLNNIVFIVIMKLYFFKNCSFMYGPQELHISFRYLDTDYDINLMKGEKSDHSVENYTTICYS